MTLDIEESLLHRVLGEMAVAQDAISDFVQPRLVSDRERSECTLVTMLGTSHEGPGPYPHSCEA